MPAAGNRTAMIPSGIPTNTENTSDDADQPQVFARALQILLFKRLRARSFGAQEFRGDSAKLRCAISACAFMSSMACAPIAPSQLEKRRHGAGCRSMKARRATHTA